MGQSRVPIYGSIGSSFDANQQAGRTVGRDELLDEFLDGGVGRMVLGELADVFGEFECDH